MSTLRTAAEAAYQHAIADPMARLDQRQLKQLRAALDAPDLTDELAMALRSVLSLFDDPCQYDAATTRGHARAVLRRYDDSCRSIEKERT